jgi:HSP20 family protein
MVVHRFHVIVPGCRKEDFTINVENNILTISFAHKNGQKEQNEKAGW